MTVAGKKAKVTFDYEAQDQDELSLKMDDIIDVLGEEEPGWWKGQQGNKIGVFPSNFVEFIDGNDIVQSKDKPVETKHKHPGLLLYAKKMLGCKLNVHVNLYCTSIQPCGTKFKCFSFYCDFKSNYNSCRCE